MCARSKQVLIDALAEFGIAAGREAGATGVWTEQGKDRGDRRAYQPLGHVPWFRAERGYGFELFPVHRTVRFDKTGDLDAGLGCQADREQVVAALARSFARVFDRE